MRARSRRRGDDVACRDAVELITDYLEGSLPTREARRLERHLATCSGCGAYLEQVRAVATSLGGLSEGSTPVAARDDLLAALRAVRQD